MKIIQRLSLETLNRKIEPMKHHRLGLSWTRTGYGSKIPTELMVQFPGSPRWRRVYCCQYSNIGTRYVEDKNGNWIVIY